jgi:hypothetical protein
MIPEAKKDAVARALPEAFGVTEFEDIRMLTAGLSSAHVFRIIVRGYPYLLRVVMDTGIATGPGRGDQTRHFANMKLAAEAGIAPRVWYMSTEDRVSITDFVDARPFPRAEALARLPHTLQRLHARTPFLKPVNTISPDMFIRRFQDANILPESETEEFFERYAHVTGVYPRFGHGFVPQRSEAGKYPFRWRPRVAGGPGSRFPERPVPRSRNGCEFCCHE